MENMVLTHYTDWRNVEAIRQRGALLCALSLMNKREKARLAGARRAENLRLDSGVIMRDQGALDPGHPDFADDEKLAEFVRRLDGFVFFWPNSKDGEEYRTKFRNKYRHPKQIGLRCHLDDLRAENHPDADIRYSSYNTGATKHAPKGSELNLNPFYPLEERGDQPLVEVVVRGKVYLPQRTEVEYEEGKWRPFFRP